MAGKTPLPVPKFFGDSSSTFSTKKQRRTGRSRLDGSPSLHVNLHAPAKTAPPLSRVYPRRWADQRPHFISFKASQSDSFLSASLGGVGHGGYDDSATESFLEQAFAIEARIGSGSFGEVFRVRSRSDGRLYAVKRALGKFRSEADRAAKLGEVQKHEGLPPHPNLVRFVRAWEERGRLYIQTELCQASLAQVAEARAPIPEPMLWDWAVDLLLALHHLHSRDLLHLDVKPENIFLSQQGLCKLGDFGLVFDLLKEPLGSAVEGDNRYMAPELFHDRPSKAVDVFSLGISLLELAADLDVPTQGEAWQALRRMDGRRDFPAEIRSLLSRLSPAFVGLLRDMLDANPQRRPSAATLLKRPDLQSAIRRRKLFINYCRVRDTVSAFFLGIISLVWFIYLLVLRPFRPFVERFLPTTGSRGGRVKGKSPWGLSESPVGERGLGSLSAEAPLHRVAMPLHFDSDHEEEEDEGLGDVSSIAGDGDAVHDQSSSSESSDALPVPSSPALFRRPGQARPPRPFNSTPAAHGKKRSRIDPAFTASPRMAQGLACSPILAAGAGGDGGDSSPRLPPKRPHTRAMGLRRAAPPPPPLFEDDSVPFADSPSAYAERLASFKESPKDSPSPPSGAGDSPLSLSQGQGLRRRLAHPHMAPRDLRLVFSRHGSSSEDET